MMKLHGKYAMLHIIAIDAFDALWHLTTRSESATC